MTFSFDELNKVFDSSKDDFPSETGSLTGNKSTEARLCAVQAIYQPMIDGDINLKAVEQEFADGYLTNRKADKKLFRKILEQVIANQESYVQKITDNLSEEWEYERIGNVEKALLMAALGELDMQKTPVKVVFNEFINISKGFFDEEEVSFINGVLNNIVNKVEEKT